jgi:hypothetical protein
MIYNKSAKIQQRRGSGGAENACRIHLRSHPSAQLSYLIVLPREIIELSTGSIIGSQVLYFYCAPAGLAKASPPQLHTAEFIGARPCQCYCGNTALPCSLGPVFSGGEFQMFPAPPLPPLCWPIPVYFRICSVQLPYRAAL